MMYAAIESMYRHGRITAAGVQAAVTRGWITLEQAQEILGEEGGAWHAELTLIPNAYYYYAGERKVWTGKAGVTAAWDDPGFVVM